MRNPSSSGNGRVSGSSVEGETSPGAAVPVRSSFPSVSACLPELGIGRPSPDMIRTALALGLSVLTPFAFHGLQSLHPARRFRALPLCDAY